MIARIKRSGICAAVALVLVLVFGSGCAYRYTFKTGEPPSPTRVKEWRHIGLWGWVGSEPFDLDQACPGGVSEFGSYINFGNWLPAFLSVGLYSPRTVYAVCSDPDSQADAVANADGGE